METEANGVHPGPDQPTQTDPEKDGPKACRTDRQEAAPDAEPPFEAVLALCDGGGRWQWRLLLLTSAIGALSAFHNVGSIFLGATPDYWCRPAENSSLPEAVNASDAVQRFGSCSRPGNDTEEPCHAWQFDTSQYRSTIVTEWSLVCGRRWLLSTVQASFMLGKLLGYPVLGALSDRFGRRRVSLYGSAVQLLVASSVALSRHYGVFLALRMLVGALTGIFSTLFTLTVEATGPKLRATAGILFVIPYNLGLMALPGVAYLVRDWRYLQLAISLPYALVLVYVWLLPESPRWLAERGRHADALAVLKRAAAANGRTLPDDEHMLDLLRACHDGQQAEGAGFWAWLGAACPAHHLLGTPLMRRRMLASIWVFAITNAIYYGVQFDSAQLSRSPYLAVFLSGLVAIPVKVVGAPLINRLGRRPTTCGLLLLTALAILAILAVPAALAWPKLLLAITGKMFISAVYSIVYLYVLEFTPTSLRNGGLGLVTMGRLGSVVAPYVVDLLAPVHWSLPSCVFGVAAITGVLVVLLLPETRGRRLPETIEDVETRRWEKPTDKMDVTELRAVHE
ncbi:organic cation transporter protein-like [Pollicipes pollicipes]|uniref:organic cation transporter protein-like n=1 Tax=Pollicipes pollicipes TaxID=41117 RepID=UPI0018852D0D|nr:organic cation transporter protein-like [Pollicipes pollicipes]